MFISLHIWLYKAYLYGYMKLWIYKAYICGYMKPTYMDIWSLPIWLYKSTYVDIWIQPTGIWIYEAYLYGCMKPTYMDIWCHLHGCMKPTYMGVWSYLCVYMKQPIWLYEAIYIYIWLYEAYLYGCMKLPIWRPTYITPLSFLLVVWNLPT